MNIIPVSEYSTAQVGNIVACNTYPSAYTGDRKVPSIETYADGSVKVSVTDGSGTLYFSSPIDLIRSNVSSITLKYSNLSSGKLQIGLCKHPYLHQYEFISELCSPELTSASGQYTINIPSGLDHCYNNIAITFSNCTAVIEEVILQCPERQVVKNISESGWITIFSNFLDRTTSQEDK